MSPPSDTGVRPAKGRTPKERGRNELLRDGIFCEFLRRGRDLQVAIDDMSFRDGKGTVYFIQVGDCGPTKIGYTAKGVKQRLEQLQLATPFTLYVRRTVDASRRVERLLHRYFTDDRIRGEWFITSPAISRMSGANEQPTFEDQTTP